ncbi:GNAT family N-acetyltransferase [Thiohalomonas denitrificans]|uniref:Acetyltransferase involved in cellulose biosynthesis, CelD/BcsL family n=1 Tax=Thiohalomonas denitrificans TaxID=415747 RepID=A0A1G5Q2X6_9GAMM|nr:GNAT family N-acetyltransferase [Thiohalomonas denitrificans]SCZ55896.1 Acetyltransferase involved in cellulose biosynthesis, CelD/BcsL family [Thiohalomonas denitrificans]
MKAELIKVTDIEAAREAWYRLEPHCECSVFQTWTWMGPWLERALKILSPWMLIASDNGVPHGLAIAVERHWIRNHVFPVKALFINEAGPDRLDFCTEYNGFLLRTGREQEARSAMLSALVDSPAEWDEVHVRRISESLIKEGQLELNNGVPTGLSVRTTNALVSRYVDLSRLRANQQTYPDSLSASRRKKIRRELRIAEKAGPLQIEAATTVESALKIFEELKTYHQLRWERSGEPGSFANPEWEAFHRDLIAQQIPQNGAQLLKVIAGEIPIGFIYSLVKAGHIYVIQTGFNYESIPELRPGETTHYMAIQWNYEQGFNRYDFLAGDSFYKQTLSNASDRLLYLTIQRPRLKLTLENMLRTGAYSTKRLKRLWHLGN